MSDDGDLLTIRTFCDRNGLASISSYVKLRKLGKGPREMRVLSKVFITRQGEADWRSDREKPDADDLKTMALMRSRGHKAAVASVASPKRK
jgi:hypothetical protein